MIDISSYVEESYKSLTGDVEKKYESLLLWKLPDGKTFTVLAKELSPEHRHVASITLNGQPLDGWTIRHEDILRGGTLIFTMK